MESAIAGSLGSLTDGFAHMSTVLDRVSGQEEPVNLVLSVFLGRLPTADPCIAKQITDWLADRPATDDVLDRSFDVVRQVAPTAMIRCGNEFLNVEQWQQARSQYRQLLDQYPDHDLAGQARQRLREAELGIELADVRTLINDQTDGIPAYCEEPARYGGADPYRGGGPHRTMLFGDDQSRDELPSSWLASDAADAVLVICAEDSEFGSVIEVCDYEDTDGDIFTVTFHARQVGLRMYELRTGDLVADTSVEIRGECPFVLSYFGTPPSRRYVASTESDVRAAYQRLINP